MTVRTVAMLTAGGLAPCLSSAVGGLIQRYTELAPDVRIIAYTNGYAGPAAGRVDRGHPRGARARPPAAPLRRVADRQQPGQAHQRQGLRQARPGRQEGQDPLHVAAEQLTADGVDVLHTIGGDDTNTTAADLAAYLHENDYELTVVGLPKTVDNDVVPIRQSLGAWTAAEQGSIFAQNIIAEHTSNPRMLIVHEVMGRNCGWLTAATAEAYHNWVAEQDFVPGIGNDPRRWDVHAVFVPERHIDLHAEAERLHAVMDELGCVNIFLSEGAGVAEVVAELEAAGQEVPRDPFGHVQLDKVNPGAWFAKQFAELLGAEKTMVQKSGYFARSAAANDRDLALIKECTDLAVDCALRGEAGVIGHDEERGDELRAIEFPRIKGGKAFDASTPWFTDLLESIGQG